MSTNTAQSSAEEMAVLKRLSSKTAQSSAEEMAVLKRLSSKTAQSSAEEMAVLKDCHQRLPKVLDVMAVLKDWRKVANLQRLEKRTREKTAEKDC